jgi:hypothetical protein
MKKTLIIIGAVALLVFIVTHPISGLNSESIVRLKEAGVSDRTSEKTIQMVIREGSFLKDTAPVIYGKDVRSIEFTTAQDIIELKKAGISDEVIQAIIYVVGESSDSQRQDAWELLRDMEIRVDLRDGD